METFNCGLSLPSKTKFNESEASRLARKSVVNEFDVRYLKTLCFEPLLKVALCARK
jgi:hypothetical protein